MTITSKSWAIVLAAGEGTRLRELTTRGGVSTPKQFCSLRGGRSLLGDALSRAARIVPRKRIVVVVAEEHRAFWEPELRDLPAENTVVQPRNRGTAAGILLPLLHVLERDPEARVALLPSDHFVEKEYVIESSLRIALESLDDLGEGVTLLGITPDAPETGYGWIVPVASEKLVRPVARFVEKPDAPGASELLARGGLWNSFLMAALGPSLVQLYERRLPGLLARFRAAFAVPAQGSEARAARIAALYEELDSTDFSRDLLQGSEERLRLEVVPPCGWTDLGTPERVEACLASSREVDESLPAAILPRPAARVDLARACLALRSSLEGEAAALTV